MTTPDRGGPLRWVDAVLVLLALAVVAVWVLAFGRVEVDPGPPGSAEPATPSTPPSGVPAEKLPRVLWLGDSLLGLGGEDPMRDVVGPVTSDLGALPVRFDGSLRAADAVRGIIRATADAEAVVLMFGTDSADAARFAPRFQGLVEEVRRTLPTADLVCAGPWRTDPDGAAIGRVVARTCAAAQGRFVDAADLAADPDLQAPDGRPGIAGAFRLAFLILLALDPD